MCKHKFFGRTEIQQGISQFIAGGKAIGIAIGLDINAADIFIGLGLLYQPDDIKKSGMVFFTGQGAQGYGTLTFMKVLSQVNDQNRLIIDFRRFPAGHVGDNGQEDKK